jgi:hypothetical protein
VLAAAGLARYADLCRDPTTHRVISGWDRSEKDGLAAFRAAVDVSGVDPPDTPALRWAPAMGVDEVTVRSAVSRALEVDGLLPGSRGWREQAVRLVEGFHTTPHFGFDGVAPLDVVRRQRAGRWASGRPTAREDVLTPVLSLLETVPSVPVESAQSLMPLVWLLEHVGDGVTLTQAGYLPKALFLEANDRFRCSTLPGFTVRTENDVHELADLHEMARRTGC